MVPAVDHNPEVQAGDIVAGYRVLGTLGVGGSGTVHRAERIDDGVQVALKLLNAEHVSNEGERQRFAREAEVVRQLAHPHVVALLDYGFDERPFLVFPLLQGRTLEARIAAEGKVGWGLTGRFSEQALSALEVAHGLSIAHRDLKPANIYCCQAGPSEHIQILDFGTAKIVGPKLESQQEVTKFGVLVGTPRYMAPEQVRSEPLTPATDVYSFGLVMAEMLLGRPLVTGATDFDMFVSQGSDAPHVLPDEILNSPFAAVIERAIAKPLAVRYRFASQMLADVRAILARYNQGDAQRHGADLEVTRFIGEAPRPAAKNESAAKLRTAFNAIASKSAAQAQAPAPSRDESALPTLMFQALVEPPPASAAPSVAAPSAPRAPTQPPASAVEGSPLVGAAHSAVDSVLSPRAQPLDRATGLEPAVASPVAPSSRSLQVVGAVAALGCLMGGALFILGGSGATNAPSSASAVLIESAQAAEGPKATAPTSAEQAGAAKPPSAPPGAFTTQAPERAVIARFLDDPAAKQTAELYELALQATASCEIAVGKPPSCAEGADLRAVIERPLAKGAAKQRLEVATKYLQHASPSIRVLAARQLASAKADEAFAPLLVAAKIEPQPAVLAELLLAMRRGKAELDAFKLASLEHTSPLVRAAACASLAQRPGAWSLEPVSRTTRDPEIEVRTACFAALTAAWVRTPDPRKEAFELTLALLEEKPRARMPAELGKLREAKTTFKSGDTVGPKWLERATFYESKRLCASLEDLALDATQARSLRGSALDALAAIAGKKRAAALRDKLATMSDEDSQALVAPTANP